MWVCGHAFFFLFLFFYWQADSSSACVQYCTDKARDAWYKTWMIFAWGMSEGLLWLSITALVMYTTSISSAASPAGQAGVNMSFMWQQATSPRGTRTALLLRWYSPLKRERETILCEFGRIKRIYEPHQWFYKNMQYRQVSSHTVIQRSKRNGESWGSLCGHEGRKGAAGRYVLI